LRQGVHVIVLIEIDRPPGTRKTIEQGSNRSPGYLQKFSIKAMAAKGYFKKFFTGKNKNCLKLWITDSERWCPKQCASLFRY
jgi:hypothetical protein